MASATFIFILITILNMKSKKKKIPKIGNEFYISGCYLTVLLALYAVFI